MTKIHVAHLLWAIFTDAQDYFNTPHDVINNPPVSHLDWIIGGMKLADHAWNPVASFLWKWQWNWESVSN
jgi:hypothetical protein